ncbi:MAG: putative glycoside hydrolase [Nitrososphaerales archaeon]
MPGEKLPSRAAQPAPAGEIDRTGYIKGIYVSAAAMGDATFMAHVKDLLENTELNAVVLDYKSDRGYISFPTTVPLAEAIGADAEPQVKDPAAFLAWFKQRNVYTIARIPAFKDNVLTKAYPGWAIVDAATGGVWRDQEKMGWVDGNRTEAWDYNVDLAREAAGYGFDEVQFDYVRFPTDGNVRGAIYSKDNTYDNRVAAIAGFLGRASDALHPLGKKVSADIFGYTPWVADDLGIGQHIEVIAPNVDVLSPMVYPSTFADGMPGEDPKFSNAIAYPYEVVNKSTERAVRRAKEVNPRIEIRPWLQDFKDYAFDYRTYTPYEIRRQMDAARDAGARGWLLWDPAVGYTREALTSSKPAFLPNTLGQVPVLAYGDVAPDVLRDDLAWLLEQGFYPTTARDLAAGRLGGVPAGRKAVVLTFDGSPASQFKLLEGGRVDPVSAAGVLLDFAAAHPADFPARGTFFVNTGTGDASDAAFGAAELASFKLQTLVSLGFEIGLMAPRAGGLDETTASPGSQGMTTELEAAQLRLAALLPGYEARTVALPPDTAFPTPTPGGNATGTPTPGTQKAAYAGAFLPEGGLATSPYYPGVDAYHIPRLPAGEAGGAAWRDAIGAAEVYISGGE